MNLTEFLLARLDEDEAAAKAAAASTSAHWKGSAGGWGDGMVEGCGDDMDPHDVGIVVYDEGRPSEAEAVHIVRHDPARVLAKCEAKRRIVEEARNEIGPTAELDWLLPLLALPYAGHADYQEGWRP